MDGPARRRAQADRRREHGPAGAPASIPASSAATCASCGMWKARRCGDERDQRKDAGAQLGRLRRPRPRPRARLHEGHRVRRRRPLEADRSASPTPGSRRCPATSTCARSPRRSRRASAPPAAPRWSSTPSPISDGVTMGTQGMKASLVSREVIADSIELTARGYQFDALVAHLRLRQDDPRLRDGAAADRHPLGPALRRLDPPGPLQGQGRHDPGHLRGGRRPREGRHDRRGAARARGRRQPGPGRLRRHVHREHDGDRLRGDGHRPDGLGNGPGGRRGAQERSPSRPASW